MLLPRSTALIAAATLTLAAPAGDTPGCSGLIIINEIRIAQPGPDFDEYFELRGAPGQSLAGLTYIVIGDLPGVPPPLQNGAIESITALSGHSLDENGLFLVAKSTFTLGTPNLIADDLNFENFDNVTHLLVRDFTGSMNQILDTNQDGTLDVTPWSEVLCSVAVVGVLDPDGITADFYYSSVVVGPDNGAVPGHVYRCSDTLAWRIGPFDIFDGIDTPGEPNPACGSVSTDVRINEIRIDQPGTDFDEYLELAGDPGTSLDGLTYIVIGDGPAALGSGVIEFVLPLDGLSLNANGYFVAAGPSFTLGVADYTIFDAPPGGFFENGDTVTHMLVQGFTGKLGQDLDPKDTCELVFTPWSGIVDAVSIVATQQFPPPPGIDCPYSSVRVGPDGPFVPGHIYRCDDKGGWAVGTFALTGQDTPGGPNPPCPELGCGSPGTSPCTVVQGNPGCYDAACCELVCKVDPACCSVAWDQACVDQANITCFSCGSPGTSPCNMVQSNVGCSDASCCETVCAIEPACCTVSWDQQCVDIADTECFDGVVAYWSQNSNDLPGGGFGFLADPDAFPQMADQAIGMATLSVGGGILDEVETNANGDLVYRWLPSFAGSGLNARPGFPAGGSLSIQGGTAAANNGAFVQFAFSMSGLQELSVSYATRGTSTGFSSQTWSWSTDGKTFTEFATVTGTTVTNFFVAQLPPLTALDNAPSAFLRVTLDGATSATGNNRFDNILFSAERAKASCVGDLNGDGVVNGADLGILLGDWGKCSGCVADLNGDGQVNGADLAIMLGAWGKCP